MSGARLEFFVRVKLPNDWEYYFKPWGYNEWRRKRDAAIEAAIPPGFVMSRTLEKRLIDADGLTLIRVEPDFGLRDSHGFGFRRIPVTGD
jgi:hypothetical protein